jgi:hypothetical protein
MAIGVTGYVLRGIGNITDGYHPKPENARKS